MSVAEQVWTGPQWSIEAARERARSIADLIRDEAAWASLWGQCRATLGAWLPTEGDVPMAFDKLGGIKWWADLEHARTAVLVLSWLVEQSPQWWRAHARDAAFRRAAGEFSIGILLLVACGWAARRRVRELCPECADQGQNVEG